MSHAGRLTESSATTTCLQEATRPIAVSSPPTLGCPPAADATRFSTYMSARDNGGRSAPDETAHGEASGQREFRPAQQVVGRREVTDQAPTSLVRRNGSRMMPARAAAGRAVRGVEQQTMAFRTSEQPQATTNDGGSYDNTETLEVVEIALQNAIQKLNATETSDVTNLRRANNTRLQTALRTLGVDNFACNADRIWWIREWRRQRAARTPQDPRNRLSAT